MVTDDDPFMGVTSHQSLPQLSNKQQKRLQNNASKKRLHIKYNTKEKDRKYREKKNYIRGYVLMGGQDL